VFIVRLNINNLQGQVVVTEFIQLRKLSSRYGLSRDIDGDGEWSRWEQAATKLSSWWLCWWVCVRICWSAYPCIATV